MLTVSCIFMSINTLGEISLKINITAVIISICIYPKLKPIQ